MHLVTFSAYGCWRTLKHVYAFVLKPREPPQAVTALPVVTLPLALRWHHRRSSIFLHALVEFEHASNTSCVQLQLVSTSPASNLDRKRLPPVALLQRKTGLEKMLAFKIRKAVLELVLRMLGVHMLLQSRPLNCAHECLAANLTDDIAILLF